jgi:CBS-domain-containing membrane protein
MPLLKRAEELMIPLDQYPHLPYWFTLRQAIAEMDKSEFDINGRKSLPRVVLVFNEQYELLGTVRRRDILRGLEPTFLTEAPGENREELLELHLGSALQGGSLDKIIDSLKERAERPVRDVMRPIIATVEHDAHIMKIIYEMVDHNLHLLPVLKDGSVVGVVRTVDVFHAMSQVLL